jgi:thiamine-phosphate pyrophosphorylase
MAVRAHAQAIVNRRSRARGLHGVYAIVNEDPNTSLALVEAILDGGVRIVQYRAKSGIVPDRARALRALTQRYGALFLLNDEWRAVVGYDADGVHLGPDDAREEDLHAVRAALPDRLIGYSCGNPGELPHARACDADYVGCGSVYVTASKADAGDPIGLAGLRAVVKTSSVPVAAIGGITLESLPDIRRTGAAMAAVIGAIAGAPDPRAASTALVRAWGT